MSASPTGPALRDDLRVRALRGTRFFVACDSETTDRTPDARVLSVAFVEMLTDGLLGEGATWYFNPGVRSHPRAAQVNRITGEHLAGRPQFVERNDDIRRWLVAPPGREHVLVGHVADFDAERLHYEFRLAGQELPPLRLLDTRRLAEAVELTGVSSLDSLVAALGLPRVDAHTAAGDAHTAARAARDLFGRLAADPRWTAEQLPTVLDGLIEPFTTSRRRARPHAADAVLSPEHEQAHAADLTTATTRRSALEVCLAQRCTLLAYRMEDGITDKARARWVVEWALDHLASGGLDRRLTGRMLAGLGVALRRCENPLYAEEVLLDRLVPLLAGWGPCTPAERCGRCLHAAGTCRFVDAARDAVEAVLFDDSGPTRQLRRAGVERFLPGFDPGQVRRGRPPEGLYQRLRRGGQLDAAGHGAALVAEFRRDQGDRGWALNLLRKAWADDCRAPHLAELLASMTVLDAPALARRDRQHVHQAIAVLDAALGQPAAVLGRSTGRLERRRSWLTVRLAAPERPAVARPRNTRQPAALRPGQVPAAPSPTAVS